MGMNDLPDGYISHYMGGSKEKTSDENLMIPWKEGYNWENKPLQLFSYIDTT